MPEPAVTEPVICDEAERVRTRRFHEARRAGLTRTEAARFSVSATDVGLLRKLVDGGCPAAMIARILI